MLSLKNNNRKRLVKGSLLQLKLLNNHYNKLKMKNRKNVVDFFRKSYFLIKFNLNKNGIIIFLNLLF